MLLHQLRLSLYTRARVAYMRATMSYLAPFNRSHAFGWSVPGGGEAVHRALAGDAGGTARHPPTRAQETVGCHVLKIKALSRPSPRARN